ncbi:MAG: signal peptide peptidase SppA [Chitinophagaceae bacterium]
MSSFFKFFFASILALLVFGLVGILILLGIISSLATPAKEHIDDKAVLVLDLSTPFMERAVENPLGSLGGNDQYDIPSLYDVVRIISQAEKDSSIKGIYIKCGTNLNGFGSSEDIRNALLHFKTSKKFIYAYADVITQGGYYVANVADKIYCNPRGGLDWRGYSMNMIYLKGTLEKLGIEPQIFYAGKFKSATEPFRESKMSDANRIQTTEILKDLYNHFLLQSAKARNLDTALLRRCATEHKLRTAADAVSYGLLDGLKYDDEVKDEIAGLLRLGKYEKINFVPIAKFAKALAFKRFGKDKIALLYAEGDIIDGKGDRDRIGSESYMNLIRKVRLDKTIKAIVFRINSGGGSAMASENIWRELSLARKEKPVILSFGDVSASGGYYLSCNADSIFAQPTTITGSIGVFSILPNMQRFFNEKLGITFDGVKTSPDADALSISKPLTESQRRWLQNDVDSIYLTFTSRVAEGRKKSIVYIDSIGQGRIWSGSKALELGLIDRIGGLQDAIDCAARMAKVKDYKLREYPEPENIIEKILGSFGNNAKASAVKEELGADGIKIYEAIKKVKHMSVTAQSRLPFDFVIE